MADATAPFRIKGETGEWEVVVGLEVHAQITATASKLFSGAATAFGAEPAPLAPVPLTLTWPLSFEHLCPMNALPHGSIGSGDFADPQLPVNERNSLGL